MKSNHKDAKIVKEPVGMFVSTVKQEAMVKTSVCCHVCCFQYSPLDAQSYEVNVQPKTLKKAFLDVCTSKNLNVAQNHCVIQHNCFY